MVLAVFRLASAFEAVLSRSEEWTRLKVRVVLLLPEDGSIAVKAGYPPEDTLEEADLAAARWAWEKDRTAGRDSDTLPGAKWLFLPMRTGRSAIGVIGIDSDLRKTPSPYVLLAGAYEKGPYQRLSADYSKRFANQAESPEGKAALDSIYKAVDRIIVLISATFAAIFMTRFALGYFIA